jgi:UDP-N-acetylmuramoylalanine--D-glutamate ligase
VPVVGETELAWWLSAAAPEPPAWLVVTGTNGKTTTTEMLAGDPAGRGAGRPSPAATIGFPRRGRRCAPGTACWR